MYTRDTLRSRRIQKASALCNSISTSEMDPNAEPDPSKYPGFTGEAFPEVFTTPPPQPTEKKPGQFSPEQVKHFFEHGFVVAEGLFTHEELEPCRQSFNELVDDIAQKLYKTGRIKNLYEDHGFKDRLYMLEKEWKGAVVLLLKLGKLTPAFQALYEHEKLLNAIEQLVGPEVAANPVWNTRPKVPGHGETLVPTHQDSGYFDLDSYKTMVITAWVAFVDSTPENGCLEFVKNVSKQGMVGVHTLGYQFYTALSDDELINRFGVDLKTDFVLTPVKAGGVVFFNNITPHRSIPNKSDHIRWAMDLRYQSADKPWGLYGMKSGILLRSPSKPGHKPDWDFFNNQDRYALIKEADAARTGQTPPDYFDTTLTGPHMDKWKILATNKHLDQFYAQKKKADDDKQSQP